MQSKLNKFQIDYIFYHLNLHCDFNEEIRKNIVFDFLPDQKKNKIIFPLSSKDLGDIKYIDEVPVIFPVNVQKMFYNFDQNNNLIFYDDLLKSAFYFLSGYQEFKECTADQYDRFSFKGSIQEKLNIPTYPVVNHYFEIIIEGIEKYCKINNIKFKRRKIWGDKKFCFLLTHDVDRVDKYTFRAIKFNTKQLIGLSPTKLDKIDVLKLLVKNIVKIFSNENPYWNFEWMKSLENKYGFNSVWYFLPQGDPSIDAFYSFEEKRIQHIQKRLLDNGDEIGLHSTYYSMNNESVLERDFESVKSLIGKNPIGNRQHWLRFKYPETLRNLEKVGIKYDTSWGFHDHIGWRNSYCLPFKPYDIENDRMMDIWEFPLTVMDVTLFKYQSLDVNKAMIEFEKILETVEKYNGLLTLLWHNNNFDELIHPGITNFYQNLLKKLHQVNLKNFNGVEIINHLKTNKNQ